MGEWLAFPALVELTAFFFVDCLWELFLSQKYAVSSSLILFFELL